MKDVKMKGFSEALKVEEAWKKYNDKLTLKTLPSEEVLVSESLQRVLAEDIYSEVNVPHFNRSAMDGYALRSEDTYGASPNNPVIFDVVGAIEIGETSAVAIEQNHAVRISTGAPLPECSNAVVMVEHTSQISERRITVYQPLTPWKNVSRVGEDVKVGEKVLAKGTLLRPQDVGILAAIGKSKIKIVKKPQVAIMSTGNELIEPGTQPSLGKTIDVNRQILSAMVKDLGCIPIDLGIVRDEIEVLKTKVAEGLERADLVLVSGGTSVGSKDMVPDAVSSLGKPGIVVHGVSIRPGKPVALAAINGKPVILLPGYPAAMMIAFYTFAKRVLASIQRLPPKFGEIKIQAKVTERIPSTAGVRDFIRVHVVKDKGSYVVKSISSKGAGIISSMVKANGLISIPEGKEGLEKGEEVDVTLLRTLED
ncbi:MAG: gephyrin-like molybdotransferase Glp [Candidatus Bathyarchaeota archaeon]